MNCTIERWGDEGSGIDMVGCHQGVIERCILRYEDDKGASGIQAKGGSCDIVIRYCRFEHAGRRAVNIGVSTGLKYFRPRPQGYEAKNITVEYCIFIGSNAPIAFVSADGAFARFNTIYRPRKWVIRIRQSTTGRDFVPCRYGEFTDNIVVFRADEIRKIVNIGRGTAPETFLFARNLWYCADDPSKSRPTLPSPEIDGVYGVDPKFIDPERGDFRLRPDSPAKGKGAYAHGEW